jgi:hypothetical protein
VVAQVDAYNGDSSSTTITLSCPGQPPVQRVLASGELATIATAWTGSCSTVTLASSGGWLTRFDNIVIH